MVVNLTLKLLKTLNLKLNWIKIKDRLNYCSEFIPTPGLMNNRKSLHLPKVVALAKRRTLHYQMRVNRSTRLNAHLVQIEIILD